jgi:DNA repair exonuclease SbcCD nuclease subunit
MFSLREEPIICGDPHNRLNELPKANLLYDMLEAFHRDVIHLGDIFHTKEKLSSKTLNLVYRKLKASKLNHVILVGNHDWHSLECTEHSLELFKDLPNVLVVDKPTILPVGNRAALFLPYYHDLQKFKNALTFPKREKTPCSVLFMHQGVTGFDYGNGFIAVDELDFEAVSGFVKVISGHFHKYQEKGNLVYLGTPYTQDHGESNQKKFLGILKPDLSLELIETDSVFPKHTTHTLQCPVTEFPDISKPGYYRFILTGSQEAVDAFPKDQFPGVKIIPRPNVSANTLKLTEKLSNEGKFQLWAKDKLDNETTKLGLELLSEVK